MRQGSLAALLLVLCFSGAHSAGPDAFDSLRALAGDWDADLPGYGRIASTVRVVSNGRAVEETIGTPANNELTVYARDGGRIVLTHYCAMTPDGHVVTMRSAGPADAAGELHFELASTLNLHDPAAPHMREVVLTFVDRDHYTERWTRTEKGHDGVFELRYARRAASTAQ